MGDVSKTPPVSVPRRMPQILEKPAVFWHAQVLIGARTPESALGLTEETEFLEKTRAFFAASRQKPGKRKE